MADSNATTVIKKVKKGGHGAAHGGAWKVAYADFVTAMMAFFLLLWLLNATTEEQKMGISNYFDPTAISRATRSGSGGLLGGTSVTQPGALKSANSPPMITTPVVARPESEETDAIDPDDDPSAKMKGALGGNKNAVAGLGDRPEINPSGSGTTQNPGGGALGKDDKDKLRQLSEEEFDKLMAQREEQMFKEAEEQLKQVIQESPDLKQLADNLKIEQTPEGLRIQILDKDKVAMFPVGSAAPMEQTQKLLNLVAQAVKQLPNKISITGHTDGLGYARGANYTNWELSSDRANASRRALIASGVPEDRIANVVGKADKEHLFPEEPNSARNRRISIVMLLEGQRPPTPKATDGTPSEGAAPPRRAQAPTAQRAPSIGLLPNAPMPRPSLNLSPTSN
jgi:chemotaxis protein MotB